MRVRRNEEVFISSVSEAEDLPRQWLGIVRA